MYLFIHSFIHLFIASKAFIFIPAGTRRPRDVPWRAPEGRNVWDLQGTFQGTSGDQ